MYPQYWAWRLSGAAASEATSLGCHTDLWDPVPAVFGAGRTHGLAGLMPPLAAPSARSAAIKPGSRGGHRPAAVLPGAVRDPRQQCLAGALSGSRWCTAPRTVLSTGTWVIAAAFGAA
jgi:L-fuculokinase